MKKIHAPGKLILSGEHAVVHGGPALAMAVNRYVAVTATSQATPLVSFELSNLSYKRGLSLPALDQLKKRIKQKYQRFILGESKIKEVLQKPVELAQFALSIFLEALNIKLTQGVKIHVESDIPMGCGMGSSAATILSIVHAIAHHCGVEIPAEFFYQLGLKAENMQHGYSSGLDLRVSLYGGCMLIDKGQIYAREIPQVPMYLVNTGTPLSTTGECVTHAAAYFQDQQLKNNFAEVTYAMDTAFQNNAIQQIIPTVQQNHQLLISIGVVPQKVQDFVNQIENLNGAAKICGAGSVTGEQAGVVLVVTENENKLKQICSEYNYSILPISGETRGVHVV